VASGCITDFKIAFAEYYFLAGRISVSWRYIRFISRSKGRGGKDFSSYKFLPNMRNF
jgi:hypothetical protein